jgi:multiple sugar transport system permease protein
MATEPPVLVDAALLESSARPPARHRSVWQRHGRKALGYGALLLFAFFYLMPFVLAFATSFKAPAEVAAHPTGLVPAEPTTRAYGILAGSALPRWAFNSIVVTVFATLGRLFLDSLAGYALARLRFPGRRLIFATVVATLAVPPIVLAIPRFIVLKELGLLNTYGGLILPLAVDAFGIFLMKQFFETIPREMEEAAKVDGATIFQTYWRIVLPLATPGLIALTILSFQGTWNEFLHPLIAAPAAPELRTLPVGLALLRGSFGETLDFPVLMAGSLLITVPVAVIFFLFQRHFISGVAASGVKG